MDSLGLIIMCCCLGGVVAWYIRNEEAGSDGALGVLGLKPDPAADAGTESPLKVLSKARLEPLPEEPPLPRRRRFDLDTPSKSYVVKGSRPRRGLTAAQDGAREGGRHGAPAPSRAYRIKQSARAKKRGLSEPSQE